MASQDILSEIEKIKAAGKPVVASYGDYAASGGYFISCKSDFIISEPNTLTGSIGVFLMMPNFNGLLEDKIGIYVDTVSTGKYAAGFTSLLPLSDEEEEYCSYRPTISTTCSSPMYPKAGRCPKKLSMK